MHFFKQEREEIIVALKEENDRLLGKIRCIEEPPKTSDFELPTNNSE